MKQHIPNSITLLNLASGMIAIILAMQGNLPCAAYMVIIASVFDFADGMVARLLHVKTEIGKQLDSLSDVVSFGVAPGIIMYQLFLQTHAFQLNKFGINFIVLLFPALYACFAAYRLAKFNIDTRQTQSFIGLPTPAAAFVLISLPFFQSLQHCNYFVAIYVGIIILLCYLMVSSIPLFSLKFENMKPKNNFTRYVLICISIILLILLQLRAIPFIILSYILLSIIELKIRNKNNSQSK